MQIRNFVIIAHIDAGKSTLADRLLEITGTVDPRRMRPQYLDRLELERERGITIKMAPVRMIYHPDRGFMRIRRIDADRISINQQENQHTSAEIEYILNLIDTPGHSDFSYEVSRALHAVEGAVLLVDAVKGIQAQTLANLRAAREAGLFVIGAVNKIDLLGTAGRERLTKMRQSVAGLLGAKEEEILLISAKTGEGVPELLRAIIEKIPPPASRGETGGKIRGSSRALIFDSLYDNHKGIMAFVRVFQGEYAAGGDVYLLARNTKLRMKETGYFTPEFTPAPRLAAGDIGYIATGLKEPGLLTIGDTIADDPEAPPLLGYRAPRPTVFAAFYPDGATEFDALAQSFARLRLNDAALELKPESNEALGRGLKVGFLGQLHFEIAASRLRDEFGLECITSFPSVAYRVVLGGQEYTITHAKDFPSKPDRVFEPLIRIETLTPAAYLNQVLSLATTFEIEISAIRNLEESVVVTGTMPLAGLLRNFDDRLKSASHGYASFSYELEGERETDATKLEIVIGGEVFPALTRVVSRKDLERDARNAAARLKELLPRTQFAQAIQAKADGRIIARETIPALKKDVTGYLYGGDRTRKMKLWQKQKRGKKRLKEAGRVTISPELFRKILEQ